VPYTQGFAAGLDQEHYKRHVIQRREFDNITLRQYRDMADHFLGAPLQSIPGTDECIRPGGDVLRYNDATQEFGVLHIGGVVGTYFRVTLGRHKFATNREYFEWRCIQ
jgi:pyocin large subunit-like protein